MDWNRFNQELRNVIDTGSIVYGTKNVKRNCYIGEPKILVLSNTLAKHIREEFVYFAKLLNLKVIDYPETSNELGSVCGKPFSISVVSITDYGKSSIEDAINSKDSESKTTSKVINKRLKKDVKLQKKKEVDAKLAAKKAERAILDNKTNSDVKEEKEVPITEDKMFKDIIKIKKK